MDYIDFYMGGKIRRPMLILAFCYIVGTWLAFRFNVYWYLLIPILLVLLFFTLLCFYLVWRSGYNTSRDSLWNSPARVILIFLIIINLVLVAWVSGAGYKKRHSVDIIRDKISNLKKEVIITGVVSTDSDIVAVSSKRGKDVRKFSLRVEDIKSEKEMRLVKPIIINVTWTRWVSLYIAQIQSKKRSWHTTSGYNKDFNRSGRFRIPAYGERWSFKGVLTSYHRSNTGNFRFADNNLYLYTNSFKSRYLSGGHGWSFPALCYSARKSAGKYLAFGIKDFPSAVGVLRALLLGYRLQLPPKIKEIFIASGTLHIFAVSGLHVGIVCLFIIFILRAFRISRVYWIIFIAPLIIAYTIATGARASAIRACIMAIVYFMAPLSGRRPDALSTVAFSLIIILIAVPAQLFDAGFIYSFVVVTGLIVLYPYFEKPMRKLYKADPLRLQEESQLILMLRGIGRYIASLIALSCSAWIVSAPLTAYFFGRFVPVALISNILVIPLAFLIVLTGCLSLILGSCIGLFADIFNHANLGLVWLIVGIMKFIDRIPRGNIEVEGMQVQVVILWYIVILLSLYFVKHQSFRNSIVLKSE